MINVIRKINSLYPISEETAQALRERVENEIELLRLLIEDPARERETRLLPTGFLSRIELEELRRKQCQDSWYKNYC